MLSCTSIFGCYGALKRTSQIKYGVFKYTHIISIFIIIHMYTVCVSQLANASDTQAVGRVF